MPGAHCAQKSGINKKNRVFQTSLLMSIRKLEITCSEYVDYCLPKNLTNFDSPKKKLHVSNSIEKHLYVFKNN